MPEYYTRRKLERALYIRRMFAKTLPELRNPKVMIYHCSVDLVMIDELKTPSIYYDHRASRPVTFMFHEIIKHIDPLLRKLVIRDRPWVLEKLKELKHKPDIVLTNSKFIQRMDKKYFDLDSYVLHPPVDLKVFKPVKNPTRDYFLSVQRVHWQKRIELQIEAFKELDEKLIIVCGSSFKPDETLVELTRDYDNITVLGRVPDYKLRSLYANAKAVIQTGYYEDFGLVPVEAMACGTPSIVVNEGGFKETIHNGSLGIRIRRPYVENLKRAVENFDPDKYSPKTLRKEAEKYSLEKFTEKMKEYIELAKEIHYAKN